MYWVIAKKFFGSARGVLSGLLLLFVFGCTPGTSQTQSAVLSTLTTQVESVADLRSLAYGPRDLAPPAGAVIIPAGSDINAVLDDYRPGTVFYLQAGEYRGASVELDRNDVLMGAAGATLIGAVKLIFTPEGEYWVSNNQSSEISASELNCQEGVTSCNLAEQLFIEDEPVRRVSSFKELAPGTFYFDYAADKIYLVDNPAGREVELSVMPIAIRGAPGATITNLTIEKYAPSPHRVAVTTDRDMTVSNNLIQLNSGGGISLDSNTVARGNRVLLNGRVGITGSELDGAVISNNEIAFNNFQRFDTSHSGAGLKVTDSRDVLVRFNYAHDNIGHGLWSDYQVVEIHYINNLVTNNLMHGIIHEVSGPARIEGNLIEGNGRMGVFISGSRDVEISANTLLFNRTGLAARTNCRDFTLYDRVENVRFSGNTVYQRGEDSNWPWGKAASLSIDPNCEYWDDAYVRANYTSLGNSFENNTYYLSEGADFYFGTVVGVEQWQRNGQDTLGTFTTLP